jgi:hypothetical protein
MSNSKAVVATKPTAQLTRPTGFQSEDDWGSFKDMITRAFGSGVLPTTIKTPEQAMVIALKGRELGLEPLYALSSIHMVNGKPGLAAELMHALVMRKYPKAKLQFITPVKNRNIECVIRAQRDGGDPQEFCYSIEDARTAGLMGKDNWKSHPAAMLRARCMSAAIRATWPECVMGCYTPEEIQNSTVALQGANAAEIDARFVEPVKETIEVEPSATEPTDLGEAETLEQPTE